MLSLTAVFLATCLGSSPSPGRPEGRASVGAAVVSDRSVPGRLRLPADRLWGRRFPSPAFAQFHDWTVRYQAADAPGRVALEQEGLDLAGVRRLELKELIQTDPALALDQAVPVGVRSLLPEAVVERLEERVDGRGQLALLAALPATGATNPPPASWRTATVDGRIFRANVFGRRLEEPTRQDVAVLGIAVDDELALDENPARVLEAVEAEYELDRDPVCGVAGWSASSQGTPVVLETGGSRRLALCSDTHAESVNESLILQESNSDGTTVGSDGIVRPASAYTEGIKRLILIRVDFPDKAGAPFTDVKGTNIIRSIDTFFRTCSYGRAGCRLLGEGSALTPTLRLPRTTTQYGTLDASKLREEARAAAKAAGFVLTNYDFDVICFGSVPGYGWAGLGYVGGPGSWVQNSFDDAAGVFCHELGHNYGLNHANFWDTAGETMIGSKGTDVEYGDSFDTMGNAAAGRRQFNVRNKTSLNWMRSTEVKTLAVNGTYRLYAHDFTNAAPIMALKAVRDPKTNYWFEYRARFADYRWLSNGIGIRRARSDSSRQSQLIDTTPGSADGKNDSPLVIGRTFSDPAIGLYVTPVERFDTEPPSIDVVFNRGQFPGNRKPIVEVTASVLTVALNTPVVFRAEASDADGDTLAYGWDFGGGYFGPNAPEVSYRWSTSGDYVVRCVVSDMKGGETSDYVVVRVGSPSTFRISGRVTRSGEPLDGVRVSTSNTRMTQTGSDGTFVLTGLARGSYTLKALGEGLFFTQSGFANPINLTGNVQGHDFIGAFRGDLETVTLVPAGAVWWYSDVGTDLGTGWRAAAFDHTDWKRGAAQLGYGDDDVVTKLDYGPDAANKRITTYFRGEFVVEDPARMLTTTLGLMRDDGAVVYLNGKEVYRSNMPSGTVTYSTLASSAVGGEDESTYYETELAGSQFLKGRNVLAVELHQSSPSSSDLSFNLRLDALLTPGTGPEVVPTLAVESGPEGLRVSWPAAFTGYEIEVAPTLESTDWAPVSAPVQTQGDRRYILIPPLEEQRFLRLTR